MATFRKCDPYQWKTRIRKNGHLITYNIFETKVDADAWAKDIETDINKCLFVSPKM